MGTQTQGTLSIARIYDEVLEGPYRVLVDRLWPRGVTKERAALDEWLKDIAPSPGLRKDFDHMESRFAAFAAAYRSELDGHHEPVEHVLDLLRSGTDVVLLYAAKDRDVNHATVLRNYLEGRLTG
ncbi:MULTISPECIES: DUF488 family protein [Arthrobacter]|uniref:DUF488 family protein n=2 Tax=Arthrobacter TaxID=1663 RepID=A0ABU9KHN8_9MICC|nr:DUF488 family protein [Arthrobacter sp. YJM1]MDP5225660.1 DUF488 family protein [Arthrobacter sp. YJM1]